MKSGNVVQDFALSLRSRLCDVTCPVYLAGDAVVGTLHLNVLQHFPLTCIAITVKGRGYVHWTDQQLRGPGQPRFKDTHHHTASEDYFERTLVLCGDTANIGTEERCVLPAGRYSYPFQCQLPARLPCSFEGEYGNVRYWVKATIEKGRKILHKTKVPFNVLSPLDLNVVPDSNVHVQESTEKSLCCWCCLSGEISVSLSIPKRGFVPGEPIRFQADISNFSSRRMNCCSVELKMTTLFRTDLDCRSTTQQVCKVKRKQKIGRGEEVTWFCEDLVVPPLPPSCLIGCSIISIKYTLELRVDPVGPAFDVSLPIEVIIGTIPHKIHRIEPHYANAAVQKAGPLNGSAHAHRPQAQVSPLAQVQPIGVPVLPSQDGHMVLLNQTLAQRSQSGASGSDRGSDRGQGQNRPPSRASNAPSTTSSTSVQSKRISVIFVESISKGFRRPVTDEHDSRDVKYAPVYPYYKWR
ncbi:arrestin domain-containing protein 3-like isoform X2 [Dreissena polymorpha]|uniref:arrestin domain-containing protein 3-like isoform X2 n=1 Tax=Dreissena polymorpha TaxID=45954 RepID=UPI00226470D9|nr:arrestin domain-containing protein 3-like isoform X2 [Dreissena polymorpha]